MRRRLAVALVLWAAAAQAQAVVADLPTPLGAERAAFLPARGARATVVVLLAGGSGIVAIGPGGETANQNFLIRTRAMWAAYGIGAVILGSPGNAPLLGRRATPAYAQALGVAVDFARSRANVPVWLVGTSQGSIAAVNGAAHLGAKVAGVVLSSSVTRNGRSGETAASAEPAAIAVPVLVVANSGDTCPATPPGDAQGLLASMPASPRKEVILFESSAIRSAPCDALSPHGYMGIEASVIQRIAAWIAAGPGR